ncbi:protein asteroid-like isoform X2 [Aphidius gifuensis]|nr:protein asteroid-like isoform X2 [Aphidius gifuensis]
MADVFKNVMKKLNIKFVMCPLEADDCIASIAKILNCPVLSYDSDFYIYGTMYIPYNTLDYNITKNKLGWMKKCKIYKVEKLLQRFKGLDVQRLPLASILLGNDYIKRSTFRNFFKRMKLSKVKKQVLQQKKIASTFNWLRKYSLNTAVGIIIESIPDNRRKKALYLIENIINSYLTMPIYMLEPLGLTQDTLNDQVNNKFKIFKFDENAVDLGVAIEKEEGEEEPFEDEEDEEEDAEDVEEEEDDDDDDDDDDDEDDADVNDELDTLPDLITEGKFAKTVPEWFMKEHLAGNFPIYFVNMITHRIFLLTTQIEDFSVPSATEISVPIIKAIFSLLIPNKICQSTLQLTIRVKHHSTRQFIKVEQGDLIFEELRDIDMSRRKEFIDKVLGIDESDQLDDIPEPWRLYVAAIIFWMRQNVVPDRTRIHLTCILVSMLIGIIEQHIGPRKSKLKYEKFKSEIEAVIKSRKLQKKLNNLDDLSITEALELVDQDDCIVASQYFMDNFKMDDKLISNPNKFDIKIVHAFAQFQSCLKHSMHLNALLGNPYTPVCPSKLFNGTLLYNIHTSLLKRNDVVVYIEKKFEYCPRLFRVFELLNKKILNILGTVTEDISKCPKRKRNKNRKKKDEDEYLTAESDLEIPEKNQYLFYDPQNPFSVLAVS